MHRMLPGAAPGAGRVHPRTGGAERRGGHQALRLCAGAQFPAQVKNFGNIPFRRLHSRNHPVIVRAERDGGSASAKFNILNQGRMCKNGYWNRPGQCGTCDDPHRD